MDKVIEILKKMAGMTIPLLKKADSVVGNKESKEALIATNEIALFLAERLKDGIGFDDAAAVWDKLRNDEDFKAKLQAGYDKIKEVSNEMKDIDLGEGIELGMVQIEFIPKFMEVFKKPEAVVEAE